MKFNLLFISLLLCVSVHAEELSDTLSRQDSYLKSIKQQIQEQNSQIKEIKNEKAKLAAQLEKAQLELEYQKKMAAKINRQFRNVKDNQKALQKKKTRLESERAELISAIRAANRYLVSNGESEITEAVLLSRDTSESAAVSQIIAQVNANLYESAKKLKTNAEHIKKNTEELERKKAELAAAAKEKEQALKEYQAKKTISNNLYKAVADDEKAKKAYLESLQKKEKAVQAKIARIKKEFEKTSGVSFRGLSTEFGKKRGKLIWPVQGHVIEKFGIKKIDGFQGVVQKKGIKIVPTQTSVKCVYDGVVMHSDNAWGLGNFIIVAHPSGFYSLYANMDNISVKKGDKLKTGSNIGTIDIDRDTNTPYLYFEIRIRDRAVDPLLWLSAS